MLKVEVSHENNVRQRSVFQVLCIIGLILAMPVLMTGCKEQAPAEKEVGATDKLRLIFITPCINEGFFDPVKKGVRDAAELMNVDCAFVGTEDIDSKEQIELVRHAIEEGYDGIALNLSHPTAFNKVVDDAFAHGIPVVAFNADSNDPANKRLSCVTQKLYEAGKSLGTKASPSIKPGAKVLMTMHSEGASALDDRLRGIHDALKDKNITSEVIITGLVPDECAEVITKALNANPEIKTILCTGQADTEGAGMAVEKNFAGKGFYVAGFDLSPGILEMVDNGTIDFTIDQQPYIQGFYPVIQLALHIRHGIMPSDIDAGAGFVTKEDAASVLELSKEGYR